MDGLFRNVSEDDCKICVINYDGDLQKYNYLYLLFEEIEKLSRCYETRYQIGVITK